MGKRKTNERRKGTRRSSKGKLYLWLMLFLFVGITSAQTYFYVRKLDQRNILLRVDPTQACMSGDAYTPSKLLSVNIEGNTYYYCNEESSSRFTEDASVRYSIDPISKKQVNKATAIIGRTRRGKLYYFESEEHLAEFRSP